MIGILQCGDAPSSLAPKYGHYGPMVGRMLGERATRTYDVPRGELPAPGECSAYVLTGSPAGVYDPLPWMPPLMEFLRATKGRAPIAGICFGHQAMAQAWGGQVVKSPKGWGVGLHRYEVDGPVPGLDGAAHLDVAASHQDQVVVPPPGARVVARSAFTPYAALDYGDAVSVQFHPEFTPEFAVALIEALRHRYGPLADPAIASHAKPSDNARVAEWLGQTLDGAPRAR